MYSQQSTSSNTNLIHLQAICHAETDVEFNNIYAATCGIIFLGTPHQGSDASRLGVLVAQLTTPFFGSKAILPRLLQKHSTELSTLSQRFSQTIHRTRDSRVQRRKVPHKQMPLLYAFIETKDTYLFNAISIGRVCSLPFQWLRLLTDTR